MLLPDDINSNCRTMVEETSRAEHNGINPVLLKELTELVAGGHGMLSPS